MIRENWTLQNSENEYISPLIYSNGKSQKDIVKEVIETFESYDVVSLKGAVGSGKSAIALQVVSIFGSGIIAVPTKILQRQYVEDYCSGNKYHFNLGNRNLRVNFMFGRSNFFCLFMGGKCSDDDKPCSRKLMKGEKRYEACFECKYWAPVYSEVLAEKIEEHLINHEQYSYQSISGQKVFFCPDEPCDYYQQFDYYTRDGAIIMNLAKWLAETWIGRKSSVPIEIIDEGDAFLDNLSFRTTISSRFFTSLRNKEKISEQKYIDLLNDFNKCFKQNDSYEGIINDSIINFLGLLIDELGEEVGSSQNLVMKIKLFLKYPNMAYAQIKNEKMTFFLSRPDITFSELKQRSGKILLMSATMQAPKIFSSVFRFNNIPLVQAEPKFPGNLKIMSTKDSMNVTYGNWVNYDFRKRYYQLLNKVVEKATRPTLVQVHALKYIPTACKDLLNKGFINGVSWSTVTDRGIDLPDEKCRSIVITKFPIPNLADIVFQVLRETFSNHIYWKYIMDMADRELVQQCGRAIRHDDDWCEIWSPDSKVLSNLLRLWKGKKEYIPVGKILE